MNRPLARITPLRAIVMMSSGARLKWLLGLIAAALLGVLAYFASIEMQTSRLQARYLAGLDRGISFAVKPGRQGTVISFSEQRLERALTTSGSATHCCLVPATPDRARFRGLAERATPNDALSRRRRFVSAVSGKRSRRPATVRRHGRAAFQRTYPHRSTTSFDAIPPLIVNSLLFIEDRELLDPNQPNRNPAIDWGRFGHALLDQGVRIFNRHQRHRAAARSPPRSRSSVTRRMAAPRPRRKNCGRSRRLRCARIWTGRRRCPRARNRRALPEFGAVVGAAGRRRDQRHRRRPGGLVRARLRRGQRASSRRRTSA